MDTATENGTGWARLPGDLILSRRIEPEDEGDEVAIILADLPYASDEDDAEDIPPMGTARVVDAVAEAVGRRSRQIVVVASIAVLAVLAYLALSDTVLGPVVEPVADDVRIGADG